MEIKPYQVHVPDTVLADLRDRLERTRWPGEIPDSGWDYGSNLGYVKGQVEYWRDGFNWQAQEEAINAFPHFRTTVRDIDIHFIHLSGKGPDPLPLVITHWWPSTFFELTKIIPLLTDPASHSGSAEDSFDVVVPFMPGYGLSQPKLQRGMSVFKVSDLWADLMTEGLGYQRFGAQGATGGPVSPPSLASLIPNTS